ncbi:restriction endonuclease subunit S [Desulfurivibrio sp. D14AmB]|uniref:restriction endonuclease subunit S n=1 Tax=Desulfurivibrio sp. D14AmB TaxID=3374370 RepID=UPI00376EEB50
MSKAINLKNGELPAGWTISKLPEFTRIVMGQSPSSKTYNHNKIGLPFFQGKAEFGDIYPQVDKYCSEPKKIAEPGATLLSVRAPVGPTNLAKERSCIGRGLAAIHPKGNIDPKFIFYLFRSIEPDISDKGTGSTFKAVTKSFVEELEFGLPPVDEQNRIIAKIEGLLSELDKGVESLKTAREQLKIYRQAVLKHAFEGKLTARWREENADKLESPEQLLARIQQERETRYQQQLQEWKVAVKAWEKNGKEGKQTGKPSKPLLFTADGSDNYPLPAGWTTIKLGDLAAESVLGKMLDKEKNTGTMCPYLGNINVRWGAFDLANLKSMKIEDSEKKRYGLHKDDLVICEGGEPARCAIWKGDSGKMFIQKALHRVRFTESYDPNFAYYYIVYAAATQRIATYFTGTTIKHLTGTGLQKIEFPLCSIAEQKEIVSLLDKQLASIEALDSEIFTGLRKSEILRQATLKKAFSGQLVPQNPEQLVVQEKLAI